MNVCLISSALQFCGPALTLIPQLEGLILVEMAIKGVNRYEGLT